MEQELNRLLAWKEKVEDVLNDVWETLDVAEYHGVEGASDLKDKIDDLVDGIW